MQKAFVTENSSARPFTAAEKKSVQALIHYQADKSGLRSCVIERAAECFLGVDDLSLLPSGSFDAAIRYLVDFQGTN